MTAPANSAALPGPSRAGRPRHLQEQPVPSPRRHLYAASAGAVLLTAAALYALTRGLHMPAVLFAFGVLVLTEAALREHRRLRRRRLEAEWARRRARGDRPAPLDPCCLLARASHGQAHDRNCTSDHSLEQFLAQIEAEYRDAS
ncbi:hypothetical protein SEA_KROMP_56 [Streptomyces phage Kromp]|uniref:Uncharacterized protein n=1 Tax=Streptomyces phage Kromp TaxID=2315619 RepID=A0A386K9D8_9CAUD|nr:hypothetical protein SEA_KROMP_56 [Streptomyces phage Kromp]